MSVPLDPRALPLWGSRLVEASAGTGKTWTIAALYLRLVLGHGGADSDGDDRDTAFGRALLPAQILVMTFTRAATRELVDRIRRRLVEVAGAFRSGHADDPFVAALIDDYPPGAAREAAAWRLSAAAEAMDDASIFTIDAWVQRMLHEHAFDSGDLFDEDLLPDEDAMLADAARDFWRREVYPLDGAAFSAVTAIWKGVDQLVDDVRDMLPWIPAARDDVATLASIHAAATGAAIAELVDAKAGWAARLGGLQAWLLDRLADAKSPFNRNILREATVRKMFDGLARWIADPRRAVPEVDPVYARKLTVAGLQGCLKKGPPVAIPPAFGAFDPLADAIEATASPDEALRRHAAARVKARIAMLKRRAGIHGFLDLQERLDGALHGPSGAALRERIVTQYPVALVDEFQDTSELQYRILDRLYGVANNARETALFLIGDPKQSIYAFRGADVHNYLRARAATTGRLVALTTNHRSTPPLVEAVNALFGPAELHDEGAFRFGPGATTPLPFVEVGARGHAKTLVGADGGIPALTVATYDRTDTKREQTERFAAACAETIVGWLDDASVGFLDADDRSFVRLRQGDIAVLVRNRAEAAAIRAALRARGIASAYLSDGDAVFKTPEAEDLEVWLQSVAEPLDARRARLAFATRLMGLSIDELAAVARDDRVFDTCLENLALLHREWRDHGVLPMLRRTLHLFELPARWLADTENGERRLTNFLHLAELLQRASAGAEGEYALIRWLRERIDAKRHTDEEEIVRLESDANLVQVLTMHKSKGLEFPVVCMPFGTWTNDMPPSSRLAVVTDDEGRRAVRLSIDAATKARADREEQQEDLRLFYVGVTRARHALWLGVPPFAARNGDCTFHRSALGYLVAGGAQLAVGEVVARLAARLANLDGVRFLAVPDVSPRTRLSARSQEIALRDAPIYAGRFERNWAIGSFSSLVRDLARVPRAPIDPAVEEEVLSGPLDEAPTSAPSSEARHRFPRGAFAGNFLHDQLEWLTGRRFALGDAAVRADLVARCARTSWAPRTDDVVEWLGQVGATTLPPIGTSLDRLGHCLPEMEFWFPGTQLRTWTIDELCSRHLLDKRPRPPLADRALNGMLMGFADLVLEVDGRYWVLDYKSNALGTRDEDYGPEAIAASMAEHRYDVQGAIYLIALHRLLRARLGDAYEPALHLGGAIYFYLRGIATPHAGCVVLPAEPAFLDELDTALSGAREEAA